MQNVLLQNECNLHSIIWAFNWANFHFAFSYKKTPATHFTVYGSFPNYTAFSPKKPTNQGRCVMSHSYAPSACGYINFHNAWLWTLVFHLRKVNRSNGIGITSDRTDPNLSSQYQTFFSFQFGFTTTLRMHNIACTQLLDLCQL